MKDVFLFNNGRLQRKDSTITFVNEDGKKKALPIEQLENIHVFSELDFNTSFFNLLGQKDVNLHIYNYYGYYSGSYIPRDKKVSGYVDVKQAEHVLNLDMRMYIAQQFVYSAVHHMLRNLRRHKHMAEMWICQIEAERKKIASANDIQTLMGMEGYIRQIYYSAFNVIVKYEAFYIQRREKRPPTDRINALISFGNSLMYTTVLSEIYKTQVNPTISFLHEPSVRRFSLALDIAEIFKPLIVDSLIFSLINNRMINKDHFEFIEEKVCMLNEEGKKIFIAEYDKRLSKTVKHRQLKRNVSYRNFIRLECYKLIKHFLDDQDYKALRAWW